MGKSKCHCEYKDRRNRILRNLSARLSQNLRRQLIVAALYVVFTWKLPRNQDVQMRLERSRWEPEAD